MRVILSFFVTAALFAPISFTYAVMDTPGGAGGTTGSVSLVNPIAANDIQGLIEMIIDIVIIFAIPVIVFFIIYAGFMYVTARGNESTISKAHMALLYALIGGVLILGARVLIEVVQGTVDEVTGPSSSRSK